jgi:hypothetical protein
MNELRCFDGPSSSTAEATNAGIQKHHLKTTYILRFLHFRGVGVCELFGHSEVTVFILYFHPVITMLQQKMSMFWCILPL